MSFFSFPRRLPPSIQSQKEEQQPEWTGDAKVVTYPITVMCGTCFTEWPEVININYLYTYQPELNAKTELVYIPPQGECSKCLAKRAQK